MAVTIRLRRSGTTKRAFFHVVATDSRSARDGRCLEKLGHYDPRKRPSVFVVNQDRLEHWLKHGATTSETVAQLLKRNATAKAPAEPKAKAKA
jgi:small subunit ribosomal protein S16